jgi:hypothetical protein
MPNAYDLPKYFYDFALMPQFDTDIEVLSQMVEPEDWEYQNTEPEKQKPILRNYIYYTYERIAEEKKIAISTDEQFAIWNSGLITVNQEPVYILFEKNKFDNPKQYWHFSEFVRRGHWKANKFTTLPEMAHYFDDPSFLVFDPRKELRANIEHIIEDNRERFPQSLQNMNPYGLQNLVKGAIDSVKERVKRNYKTAIPQYYRGAVQLLLPLCLTDSSKADLALVIERFNDFYRASTCLTLDMAYNNARQITRPDREWLQP